MTPRDVRQRRDQRDGIGFSALAGCIYLLAEHPTPSLALALGLLAVGAFCLTRRDN